MLHYEGIRVTDASPDLKELLQSIAQQAVEEERERILSELPEEANERNSAKVSVEYTLNYDNCLGWNYCLSQVKSLINKNTKEVNTK